MSSATDSAGLGARLFVALQHLIPQHFLTSVVYKATRSRTPLVKNALIKSFMHGFHPDMSDAAQPDPLSYPSFNEFFTRALRPDARPISPSSSTLVSPVDGTISQIGRLDGSHLLQAKGHSYSLEALLDPAPEPGLAPGGNGPRSAGQRDAATETIGTLLGSGEAVGRSGTTGAGEAATVLAPHWARQFVGGAFATLYLAPYNYHRIHMPLTGTLRAAWYVPGQLFSVNATTAAAVAGLFARNERVVCLFEDGPIQFAMVLVGALFVGSMTTVWHGEITPRSPRSRLELPINEGQSALRLAKGIEMGRFNMGSTVILLLPPAIADWLPALQPGDRIRVGQPLGKLTSRVVE